MTQSRPYPPGPWQRKRGQAHVTGVSG